MMSLQQVARAVGVVLVDVNRKERGCPGCSETSDTYRKRWEAEGKDGCTANVNDARDSVSQSQNSPVRRFWVRGTKREVRGG